MLFFSITQPRFIDENNEKAQQRTVIW